MGRESQRQRETKRETHTERQKEREGDGGISPVETVWALSPAILPHMKYPMHFHMDETSLLNTTWQLQSPHRKRSAEDVSCPVLKGNLVWLD